MRGETLALEVPLHADEDVPQGGLWQRALDGAQELVIDLFKMGLAQLKAGALEAVTEPPHRRGRFVTFEGGEGAGKSTQLARLAERLADAGYDVMTTREPGGSPGAEAIRHVLLSGAGKPFGPVAEAILFGAARADHVADRHRAGARRRHVGAVRPLHRFDPRLSGRARPGRSAAHPRAGAGGGRRHAPRSDPGARRSGRARPRPRARPAGRAPGPVRERGASPSTAPCATPIASWPRPSRSAASLIDASRKADEVAAAIWQAVTSRLIVPDSLAAAREVLG